MKIKNIHYCFIFFGLSMILCTIGCLISGQGTYIEPEGNCYDPKGNVVNGITCQEKIVPETTKIRDNTILITAFMLLFPGFYFGLIAIGEPRC